ncbi:hypothetical protein BJY04DRAFT_226330 [Aspergillus karnatakaensis]|uniref:Zn(II)2Cys6 transcription factor domain-containing protein n=1 Tax=Aspergillus karnatakaensis TaxID=1810916 RepID=UPI003CCD0130
MGSARTANKKQRPPRKKACTSCTRSKVRCDLERPACTRCKSLGRACAYTTPVALSSSQPSDVQSSYIDTNIILDTPLCQTPLLSPRNFTGTALDSPTRPLEICLGAERDNEVNVDLSQTDLIPNVKADDIRDRWLRPYILPSLDGVEVPKLYQPFTLQYISRVLSSYPQRMLRDGDAPSIIHPMQVAEDRLPQALANCYTLVRMWVQAAPGSEGIVVGTVEREMERLAGESPNLHDIDHLAAFQAYFIYCILMYFSPRSGLTLVTDKTMITLMELAFRTARHGLLSAAELSHTTPTWESWIVASTKRRAIYAMYLFTSVYNADHSLPNFIADELRGVFVPEGKALWEAKDRSSWTREYDCHLREWPDGMLEISELWQSEETGSAKRRERVERWLKSVDEFGMMLFSVCAHIHGC